MSYKIKELQEELKPRYRAKTKGLESLSDEDLLSLIIRCGTKSKNVKELSLEVLQQIGTLNNFLNVDMKDLESIKGIGEASALSILASIELGKRILKFHKDKVKLINSKLVYAMFKYELIGLKQEVVIGIYLDNAKQLICFKELFRGTVNECNIHPREIFKYAVSSSASSIILVHNHPSGNINPSIKDEILTEKVSELGNSMNIPLIDHIIIGSNGYYSLITKKSFIEE